MKTKHLDFPFEVKEIREDGWFSGYGSVFGVKDSYNEIVVHGAFAKSIEVRKPALLWQHRSDEPIGVYDVIREDDVGLYMEGRMALKTQRGAEGHELMKMGAVSGLSIGFVTLLDEYDRKSGITYLKEVDLWETSIVTFPANQSARVTGVKSISEILTLPEIEDCLRDAGFSRRESIALIARVKAIALSDSEMAKADADAVAVLSELKSILKI